jgi:hypothetical protein
MVEIPIIRPNRSEIRVDDIQISQGPVRNQINHHRGWARRRNSRGRERTHQEIRRK